VLKYGQEYFNHGIAPISYSWQTKTPDTVALNFPTKQELGIAGSLVSASKTVRDNARGLDDSQFFTSFNSSSIFATAKKEGEALVSVQLALEYPEEYRLEQNWFDTSATVKVTEKLSISVPEYSRAEEQQTHLYMVPPNCKAHIKTNR